MIQPSYFNTHIVRPVLETLGRPEPAAINLVGLTCMTESGLKRVHQYNDGPARGLCQMEKPTHDDHFANFLGASHVQYLLEGLRQIETEPGDFEALVYNPFYAVAMCRIHYLRVSEPLPDSHDTKALAEYWKDHYNTHQGAGHPDDFLDWARHAMI